MKSATCKIFIDMQLSNMNGCLKFAVFLVVGLSLSNGRHVHNVEPSSASRVETNFKDETLSLKTAILFHYINYFGFCIPEKIPTMEVKKCFSSINTACALVGERTRNKKKARKNKLTKLCFLAYKSKDVSRWFTIAGHIAQALCAACSELATDEEKTVCEKKLCM